MAFDELAAIIVVQRLSKHRLNAGLASYDQFSRGRFGKVELVGVPVLCVISLDARHNQPYLRNLVRPLRRQRATEAHLIIEAAIGDKPLARGGAGPSDRKRKLISRSDRRCSGRGTARERTGWDERATSGGRGDRVNVERGGMVFAQRINLFIGARQSSPTIPPPCCFVDCHAPSGTERAYA